MAGSLTFSVDICVRQNVSWSKDNKIAVNVDKELYILVRKYLTLNNRYAFLANTCMPMA